MVWTKIVIFGSNDLGGKPRRGGTTDSSRREGVLQEGKKWMVSEVDPHTPPCIDMHNIYPNIDI